MLTKRQQRNTKSFKKQLKKKTPTPSFQNFDKEKEFFLNTMTTLITLYSDIETEDELKLLVEYIKDKIGRESLVFQSDKEFFIEIQKAILDFNQELTEEKHQ